MSNQLVWLHIEWSAFRSIFGHSDQRIDALNRRTGHVFRLFQDALLDRVILGLARLADPPKTLRDENVSFPSAQQALGSPAHLVDEYKALRKTLKPMIEHRHKRIAHNDRLASLDESVLPGISRQMVTDALTAAGAFYNRLSDSPFIFDRPIDEDQATAVDRLLRVLRAGNAQLDALWEAEKQKWPYEGDPPDYDDVAPSL